MAYERALELAPGDGFLLDRLEALGALKKLTSPDGQAYWLTPADFDRVVRAELASLYEQGPDSADRSRHRAGGGWAPRARRVAGQLAARLDPDDVTAQDLIRLGQGPGRRSPGG